MEQKKNKQVNLEDEKKTSFLLGLVFVLSLLFVALEFNHVPESLTYDENIIDEAMFISRASEGAVSMEWIMDQPIFIRKKYLEHFKKEMEEREARLSK